MPKALERPCFPANIYVLSGAFLHSPLALLLLTSLVIRIVVFVVGTATPEHENVDKLEIVSISTGKLSVRRTRLDR